MLKLRHYESAIYLISDLNQSILIIIFTTGLAIVGYSEDNQNKLSIALIVVAMLASVLQYCCGFIILIKAIFKWVQ